MSFPHLDGELKKGSAEFLILSLVEDRALHGYDIARLVGISVVAEVIGFVRRETGFCVSI